MSAAEDASAWLGSPARDAAPVEALIACWRRTGDPRLRERAVRRGMPLARRIAHRYRTSHEPFDDLVQVANVGLVKAVDRFDPERCHVFERFAVPTIAGELRRHFRSVAWTVHPPRSLQEAYLSVREASERLLRSHGRAPTVAQLCAATGLDEEVVVEALQVREAQRPASLDQPLRGMADEGCATTLADLIGKEDPRFSLALDSVPLASALARLRPRELRAVVLRFGCDLVQREIAAELGCSQMQVSRDLRRALATLREAMLSPDEGQPASLP